MVFQTNKFIFWVIIITCINFFSCSSSYVNPAHLGAFILENDHIVSIRKSSGNTLRYRIYQNGETGRLYPISDHIYISGTGFSSKEPEKLRIRYLCDSNGSSNSMEWIEKGSKSMFAKAVNTSKDVTFKSGGITLTGRLDLPDQSGPFPAVILVHGSGADKATDFYYNGDFFAANGIAALTFNKRGTGASEGKYTFNYYKLANDVVAATEFLRKQEDIDPNKIGLSGYSQGGWVAPLAASLSTNIQFVVVNYGMIESAVEEARLETRNTLQAKGVEAKYLNEVDELTVATVKVVASGFISGWDEVRRVNKKYKKAPWRNKLKGTTVHQFLKYPNWIIKMIGPGRSPFELDWYYDSTPILDSLEIPMAWLLPDSDTQAPNELTIPKLKDYQKNGKPFYLQIFPNTDHNMLMYELIESKRKYTKYSHEFFEAEVYWVKKLINSVKTFN